MLDQDSADNVVARATGKAAGLPVPDGSVSSHRAPNGIIFSLDTLLPYARLYP